MRRSVRLHGVLVALVLFVAAACTDTSAGSGGSASSTEPSAAAVASSATSTEKAPTQTTAEQRALSTTVLRVDPAEPWAAAGFERDELLELWASDRERAVERITAAGWGLDEQTLAGPGGLQVDLGACPAAWTNEPVLGNEISLTWWSSFHWAADGRDAQLYLDWLGDDAAIAGRTITIIDEYFEAWNPSGQQTEELQRTQTETNRTQLDRFAAQSFGVLGFTELEQSSSFLNLLGERCLPAFVVRSRQTRANVSPFVGASPILSQSIEAKAWLEFVDREAPGGTAAVLVMDNTWGRGFQSSLEGAMRHSHDEISFRFVSHDPAAQSLGEEAAELLGVSPDVIFLATAGQPCAAATTAIRTLDNDVPIVVPNACTDIAPFIDPIGARATNLHAAFSLVEYKTHPFGSTSLSQAMSQGPEHSGVSMSLAWFETWYAVEVLKIAAELPGGLTRTNALLAMWSFEGHYPFVADVVDLSWESDEQLHDTAEILEFDLNGRTWHVAPR